MMFRTGVRGFLIGSLVEIQHGKSLYISKVFIARITAGLHHEVFSHQMSIPRQSLEVKL
jgi:hypothetical protein